jgi:hypothetical protein
MRKRLLALLLCLSFLFLAIAFFLSRPRVNRESYGKIQVGMSSREVECIFGAGPGDYRTGPVHLHSVKQLALAGIFPAGEAKKWYGDDGHFAVWFDDKGVVTYKHMVPGFRVGGFSSFLYRLRELFGS